MKPLILAISGSLRQRSFSTAILRTIAEEFADLVNIHVRTLDDIPMYNEDNDGDKSPDVIVKLRDVARDAAGVIFATPEYNHGMSGAMKNAIDWLSRPYFGSPLVNKPVLNITSSPAFIGGVRAHSEFNEAMLSILARIVLRPAAVIPAVHEKIVDDRLIDGPTLRFLRESVEELLRMAAVPASETAKPVH